MLAASSDQKGEEVERRNEEKKICAELSSLSLLSTLNRNSTNSIQFNDVI
jgi:hypothetical protein